MQPLIRSLLTAAVLAANATPVWAASLCIAQETTYFSCPLRGGSGKMISLCGGQLRAADGRLQAWLQYRIGHHHKRLIMAYPPTKAGSMTAFAARHTAPAPAAGQPQGMYTLWFSRENYTYGMEVQDATTQYVGTWVQTHQGERIADMACTGAPDHMGHQGTRRFMDLVNALQASSAAPAPNMPVAMP